MSRDVTIGNATFVPHSNFEISNCGIRVMDIVCFPVHYNGGKKICVVSGTSVLRIFIDSS